MVVWSLQRALVAKNAKHLKNIYHYYHYIFSQAPSWGLDVEGRFSLQVASEEIVGTVIRSLYHVLENHRLE